MYLVCQLKRFDFGETLAAARGFKEGHLTHKLFMVLAFLGALVFHCLSVADAAESPKFVRYVVVDENSLPSLNGPAIIKSLTGKKGDPSNGRKVVINRKKGNCLACHVMPIAEQPYHGEVGPELHGVASRYQEGELRLLIVNAKLINEDTIMPAFYRNSGFTRVHKKFKGKTILSAQQIEDVVAYLLTLK